MTQEMEFKKIIAQYCKVKPEGMTVERGGCTESSHDWRGTGITEKIAGGGIEKYGKTDS